MSSTYNNTKELRFWCQKVLPLVYDDSLSYYELLNKIVVYLNSTIEDVQAMIADVTRIEQGLSSKIDLSQKGVANGVATLNGNGQVPLSQLPDISAGVQTISVNGVNVPADANKNVNIIVMTNAVSNLVNYYLKSETYNKTEVNALIDSVKNSRFEVVAELPTTDIQTNVIYLVPKSVGQTTNGYDEFINLNGTTSGWELIGSTDIDLSGYVTDSELTTALSTYVTTQSLNTTLAGYVTSGALASTLEGYVTNATFQSLSGTVASQGDTLAGLVTAVNDKVNKVTGKGLSTNDYTNEDKARVTNAIQWGDAEKSVQQNIFNPYNVNAYGASTQSVTENGKNIRIVSTSNGQYRGIVYNLPVKPNTYYKIKSIVSVTSGKYVIKTQTVSGTTIVESNPRTTDDTVTLSFNSGNNELIKFALFITWDVASEGDVTFSDTVITYADAPIDFVPYIPDNTELMEKVIQSLPISTTAGKERVTNMLNGNFDLNDLSLGLAFVNTGNVENISHKPSDVAVAFTVFTIEPFIGYIHQFLIKRDNTGDIYTRSRSDEANGLTWSSWYKFTGTVIS